MPGVHVCGICEYTYNETDRKPLVLLCGHTYCQLCLHNVVSGSSPACPSCRKEIVSPVDELPVNFVVIPSSSGEAASRSVASTKMFCNAHQNELDYWCSRCKVLICKRCLVPTHAKHEFILAEEIFADEKILPEMKGKFSANLLQVKASLHSLQQLESLSGIIDQVKSSTPQLKRALLKQESTLSNLLEVWEGISSESSAEHKNLLLEMLRDRNQIQSEEDRVNKVLKPFQDQVVQCQIYNSPNGKKRKLTDTKRYMPHGHPWFIISNELAEKALCTMKETGHRTPRATVKSTDESPILCLLELLQYLVASSATMELQLMDKAVKNPDEKFWLPLKAGGKKSTIFNHCYRLQSLSDSLMYFQTSAIALTAVGDVVNDAAKNKVIILVYPATRTYEVCVLAFGKVVKGDTGSWPLPLEVHVIGMNPSQHWEWVKCILPSLYYIAQPDMGECRVYLPGCDDWYSGYLSDLCFALAELGKKFSTQHRVYFPVSVRDEEWKPAYLQDCQAAAKHKITLESWPELGIPPYFVFV